jgi:hypothetical protein
MPGASCRCRGLRTKISAGDVHPTLDLELHPVICLLRRPISIRAICVQCRQLVCWIYKSTMRARIRIDIAPYSRRILQIAPSTRDIERDSIAARASQGALSHAIVHVGGSTIGGEFKVGARHVGVTCRRKGKAIGSLVSVRGAGI